MRVTREVTPVPVWKKADFHMFLANLPCFSLIPLNQLTEAIVRMLRGNITKPTAGARHTQRAR